MVLRELFARLGLSVDAQSFAQGQLAVEGVKLALGYAVQKANELTSAFVDNIKATVAAAGGMEQAAAAVDLTVERLQKLDGAAEVAGASTASLRDALKTLKGETGGADKALLTLADQVAAAGTETERTQLAVAKLGETTGRDLVPLLAKGSAEIERLAGESAAFTSEQVRAAADLGRAQVVLTGLVRQFWRAAIGPLLPVMNMVVQRFLDWKRANEAIARQRIHTVMQFVADALVLVWHGLEYVYGILKRVGESLTYIGRMLYDRIVRGLQWMYTKAKEAFGYLASQFDRVKEFLSAHGVEAAIAALTLAFTLLGAAGTKSAIETAIAWAGTLVKFLAIGAILSALYLAFDDIATYEESIRRGGTGKNTLYGKWKGEIDKTIAEFKDAIGKWLTPSGADPWWLRAVKELVNYLTRALGIAEKLEIIKPGLGGGVVPTGKASLGATATRATWQGLGNAVGLDRSDAWNNFWKRQREGEEQTGSLWGSIKAGFGYGAGGESPILSPSAAGGGTVINQTRVDKVEVHPSAGMDEEALSSLVVTKIREAGQSEREEVAASFPAGD